MYVYIDSRNNKIDSLNPNQLPARDGFIELVVEDSEVTLTNYLQYLVYEDGKIVRHEHTEEEFQALTEEYKANPSHYPMKRKLEYPPIEDFADAWVKQDETALEEYRQKCLAVKAKYPKPL